MLNIYNFVLVRWNHILATYNSHPCSAASSMRLFAISQKVSSFSIPIHLRPVFCDATAVLPEPIQLSRIVSPGIRATAFTFYIVSEKL